MPTVTSRTTWIVVVLQHLVYLFVLHSRSGRGAAALGLIAAAFLVGARPRLRFTWAPLAILAAFVLPAVSLLHVPQIAFVSLDGRLWVIAAWLFAASMLQSVEQPRWPWQARLPLFLAVIWSSFFWLALVSDIGVGGYLFSTDRIVYKECQSDPLAVAFSIWETHPVSEHLFLGWRTFQSLEEHHPYANHVHPYLFAMYGWALLVRAAAGVPLFVATNTVPVLYMAVLVAAVFTLIRRARLVGDTPAPLQLAALFTACGLVVTTYRFWNDLLRYSSDNPYPLLAGVLIFVAAGLIEPVNRRMVLAGTIALVALSPVHTPMVITALACLFWFRSGATRQGAGGGSLVVRAAGLALVTGAVAYMLPWLLIRWHGYTPVGSPFLFRSGLDGDTRYFTNMIQAVVSPCANCCWGRPTTDLLFPAFVPLVAFAALRGTRAWRSSIDLSRILLFLLAPYLFSLVLFPQSISIHPYMYDHMLILPLTLAGIVLMFEWVNDRAGDPGPALFGLILIGGGVAMSNLIAVAQGLSRMPLR
ncbi:MAG TPA: hypothetical protein VGI12_11765 [Vicinamibacterales bacterium]